MDIGKKAVLEEEWIPNFLEDKKINLECKNCGNKSLFLYRQTEGATIYPANSIPCGRWLKQLSPF